jgi:PTS system nitrogen regulatory IIA component
MTLSVRDVAKLLDVSEKTVYRWVSQQKLPASKMGDQYRFNRAELLEWATANQVRVSPKIFHEDASDEIIRLEDSLRAGGVFYRVAGTDKESVIREVVQIIPLPEEVDRPYLLDVLLARESLGSTGVGDGIAIPHVRNPIVMHIQRPMIALCFLENSIDFAAIDGKPVHTLFTIVSPTTRAHLKLLSGLAYALRDNEFAATISSKALREDVFAAAKRIDSLIAPKVTK